MKTITIVFFAWILFMFASASAHDWYSCLNREISKYEAKASFKNLDFKWWRQFKANADYRESMCNE